MIETKLDLIIKSFPLIFVILTAIGYINIQSYYYFFDIEIINYLEISEIPLLFFNKSILIILLLISLIIFVYFIDDKISQEVNDDEKDLQVLEKKTEKFKKTLFKGGWFLISIIIFFIMIDLFFANYIGLVFLVGYLLLIIIHIIIEKTLLRSLIRKDNSSSLLIIYFGFLTVMFFNLFTISNSIEKGYKLKYQDTQSKIICFVYDGKIINTNKRILYIGETKKFLFLFDKLKEETLIFKTEEINDLKFRLKNK
jgi:hypothetical protein